MSLCWRIPVFFGGAEGHADPIFRVGVSMFKNTLVTYASRTEGVLVTLGEEAMVLRTGAYTVGNMD
jgi:hypothetical protein